MAGMRLFRSLVVNSAGAMARGGDGATPRDLPGETGLGARGGPRLLYAPGAGCRQADPGGAVRHPATLGAGVAGAGRTDLSDRGGRGGAGGRPPRLGTPPTPRAVSGLPPAPPGPRRPGRLSSALV